MILMMVPAGAPVTEQIDALTPLPVTGRYPDRRRQLRLEVTARNARDALAGPGPEVPRARCLRRGRRRAARPVADGGRPSRGAWDAAEPILTSIAAKFGDSPCAAYFGAGGAGHYVKTVHNGIEYADMQMIAEIYGLMRDGQGRAAADIGGVFARWNGGPLESYLIEIAAEVAAAQDPDSGVPMLDVIADRAGQKGTGRWTVIDAQRRAAPLPAVEAAVTARVLSGEATLRAEGARAVPGSRASRAAGGWRPRGGAAGRQDPRLFAGLHAPVAGPGRGRLDHAARYRGPDVAGGVHHPLGHARRHGRRTGGVGRTCRSPSRRGSSGMLSEATFRPCAGHRRRDARGPAGPGAVGRASAFRPDAPGAGHGQHDPGLRDRFGAHGFERVDRPGETGLHGPWVVRTPERRPQFTRP
jgi:6-phosphogluconate dehydrogenase